MEPDEEESADDQHRSEKVGGLQCVIGQHEGNESRQEQEGDSDNEDLSASYTFTLIDADVCQWVSSALGV